WRTGSTSCATQSPRAIARQWRAWLRPEQCTSRWRCHAPCAIDARVRLASLARLIKSRVIMPNAWNTKQIAHIDCAGGGQVWIDGTTLYVGHMRHPTGTSIYDIADPKNPKQLARIDMPEGWHSHKVRAQNGIMIVNHERNGKTGPEDFGGGLAIYDVSKPAAPKLITKWMTARKGVHRYDFAGRYAYI